MSYIKINTFRENQSRTLGRVEIVSLNPLGFRVVSFCWNPTLCQASFPLGFITASNPLLHRGQRQTQSLCGVVMPGACLTSRFVLFCRGGGGVGEQALARPRLQDQHKVDGHLVHSAEKILRWQIPSTAYSPSPGKQRQPGSSNQSGGPNTQT